MPDPDPRYPIGRYQRPAEIPPALRAEWLRQVAEAPAGLRAVVTGLTEAQLDTPYRDGGWTVRQVVHHVPDSHLNAYMRFRLALTEEQPAIKTYEEARWAELPDGKTAPVEISLALLDALHVRWMVLLEALRDADFQRTFRHPELGVMALDTTLGLYAWHGRHHAAHIRSLRERMGW